MSLQGGLEMLQGSTNSENFYIDNERKYIDDPSNQDNDTAYSWVNYTLDENVENLTLLSLYDANGNLVPQEINGKIVYGHPTKWNLDFIQGSNINNYDKDGNPYHNYFNGDCGIVSSENVLIMAGKLPESSQPDDLLYPDTQENAMVQFAINNDLCETSGTSSELGGTNPPRIVEILRLKGIAAGWSPVWLQTVEAKVKAGYGVILGLSGDILHGGSGTVQNHAITVTGVVYDQQNNLEGFYICDSATEDEARYVSKDLLLNAIHVLGAYQVITDQPIQFDNDNINGTGNNLDNTITGNDGNNILTGLGGNDTIDGAAGADKMYGGVGNDTYIIDNSGDEITELADEGIDNVKSSVSYNLGANLENLYLTGDGNITGAGNSQNNYIYGNDKNNILNGLGGNDKLYGGGGNDTYIVDDSGDEITELANEGTDNVKSSVSYNLGENLENLYLTGDGNITGAGNSQNNYIYGNDKNNILNGLGGNDVLYGGKGYDTYITGDGNDTIFDIDGSGEVKNTQGYTYTGGKKNEEGSSIYQDNEGNSYIWGGNGSTLLINGNISIKNFVNGQLGITLTKEDDPDNPPNELGKDMKDNSDDFEKAKNENIKMRLDPLALDLDSDGIEIISVGDSTAFFDLDQDGMNEQVEWLSKDDGFLALDKNQNGKVDNLDELFGKANTIGFEELKQYDLNADGIIDSNDAVFSKLKVWQDLNSNGIGEDGETKALSDYKIKRIDLNYAAPAQPDSLIGETSTFYNDEGRGSSIIDLNLSINQVNSSSTFDPSLVNSESGNLISEEDIINLPNIRGYGNIKNLLNVASENPEFKEYVKYLTTLSGKELYQQMDTLLAKWTGTQDILGKRGELSAQKIAMIENFMGQEFTMTLNGSITSDARGTAARYLNNIYYRLIKHTYTGFMIQNQLKDCIDVYYNMAQDKFVSLTETGINQEKILEKIRTYDYEDLCCLNHVLSTLKNNNAINVDALINNLNVNNLNEFITLQLLQNDSNYDFIIGTSENETLTYNDFNKNNICISKEGNDTIISGQGNDILIYNKGDGSDVVYETTGNDIIYFGEGITEDDLLFSVEGRALVINFKNSPDDRLAIYQQDYQEWLKDVIKLSDGTVLNYLKIKDKIQTIQGTSGNDSVFGTGFSDTIYANDGNDAIIPFYGDDTISGGKGNDYIEDLDGNETYLFNRGDNHDIIYDTKGTDKIILGEGITINDISFVIYNYDINIYNKNTGDLITILYQLTNSNYGVETLQFSDGTTLTAQQIQQLAMSSITYGSNSSNNIEGTVLNNTIMSLDGNDTVSGNDGDDIIYGGAGNDVLDGGNGNDAIIGADDNDIITGGAGNDFLVGSIGKDQIDGGDGNDRICVDEIIPLNTNIYSGNTVTGGKGNDTIYGGYGMEYYIFNKGDGHDTIYEFYDFNVFKFGENITYEDIMISLQYNTVVIDFKDNPDDKITIIPTSLGFLSETTFEFSNGTTYKISDLLYNDTKIIGNDGDNQILAYYGDNTITGGKGNDTLESLSGNNTFIFNPGDGKDNIYNASISDNVKFGEGITLNDLIFNGKFTEEKTLYIKHTRRLENIIITFKNNSDDMISLIGLPDKLEFSDGSSIVLREYLATQEINIQGDSYDNLIKGYASKDSIYGYNGSDTIIAYGNDDVIFGGSSNDVIYADSDESTDITMIGNDTIIGGSGNDLLYGYYGNDLYIFNKGDGEDQIYELSGADCIQLGEGFTADDLVFNIENNVLIIRFKNSPLDKITLYQEGGIPELIDNTIKLSDGTVLDSTFIMNRLNIYDGSLNNDILTGSDVTDNFSGYAGNDTILGLGGNDILNGGIGNDNLYGGEGDDTYIINIGDGQDTINDTNGQDVIQFSNEIYWRGASFSKDSNGNLIIDCTNGNNVTIVNPEKIEEYKFIDGYTLNYEQVQTLIPQVEITGTSGDDILIGNIKDNIIIGGTGNDTLKGYHSDDTYIFNSGDGQDIINDTIGTNKIKFNNINQSDITVSKVDDSCIISIKGTTDSVTINNWALNNPVIVEFANGSTINRQDLENMLLSIDITGTIGNDSLTGNTNDNIIVGGAGNDTLNGAEGDDIYIFNPGDGQDIINDTFGTNKIKFNNINKSNIKVSKVDDDFIISINGTTDRVTIKNWSLNKINSVIFADGIMNTSQLENLLTLVEITGTISDDNLIGNIKDNIITGRAGNDTLNGAEGNDTYIFNPGDGQDIINDTLGINKITFNDIDQSNIKVSKVDDDFIISINGTTDSVTIKNWSLNKINSVIFTKGTMNNGSMSTYQLEDLLTPVKITGTSGDDNLIGNIKENILTGGTGNDTLNGAEGDDGYIFNPGDGQDIINDTLGRNAIVFKNINKSDITVSKVDDDFIISINGTTDSVTIKNWSLNKIDTVIFADELMTAYQLEDLLAPVQIDGTALKDNISGNSRDNILNGFAGNDTIYGLEGNDIIDGGLGYDSMIGGLGDDTYYVDSIKDAVIENYEEGVDTVISTVSLTLQDNIENLILAGTSGLTATGNLLDNVITGNSGNNTIKGGNGNDTLIGNDGSDRLYGENGDNLLIGGTGNDYYYVKNSTDIIVENIDEGTDYVYAYDSFMLSDNIENLYLQGNTNTTAIGNNIRNIIKGNYGDNFLVGMGGNDNLYGGDGNDNIYGGDGNDYLYGEGGSDILVGGTGNDYYYITNSSDITIEYSDEGTDYVYAYDSYTLGENIEHLYLQDISDIDGTGNSSNNYIRGNEGNNILIGLTGDDSLYGGEGDDIIEGGEGNDRLNGEGGINELSGGLGNDTYYVKSSLDVINENADEGIDTVYAYESFDLIDNIENLYMQGTEDLKTIGNDLNNNIRGNAGNNIIEGLSGNDTIFSYDGDDAISGDDGDDYLYGGNGNDTIEGGEGNDRLYAEGGINELSGGLGNDTFYVKSSLDVINENADEGIDTVFAYESFTLGKNIETLYLQGTDNYEGYGNELNNNIRGNAGNNIIEGLSGNDTIFSYDGDDAISGDDGDDYLYSGNGNDTVEGGIGNDRLYGEGGINELSGGLGDDIYYIKSSLDVINENANEGIDTVYAYESFSLDKNIENLYLLGTDNYEANGNDLNNSIRGNTGNNIIEGLSGNDTIYSYDGDDAISGDDGNDYISGGNGNDIIQSSQGNDTIYGGEGDDIINGGSGNDTLYGDKGNDTYAIERNTGSDYISDSAGTDKVVFSSDITKSDIGLFMKGYDLTIGINSDDKTFIRNQKTNGIERFELSTGEYITDTEMNKLIQDMTAYATSKGIQLTSIETVKNNNELMTMVTNSWHN